MGGKALLVPLFLLSFVSLSLCGTFGHGLPPSFHVPSDFDPETAELSDEWAVRLREGVEDVHKLAFDHGFNVHRLGIASLKNVFIFKEHPQRSRFPFPHLNLSEHVEWAEQQIYRLRVRRSINFNDPSYEDQWHYHSVGKDINILPVWESGNMGEGCQIAIVDDGLQWRNPDLSVNYDPLGSYDFNYDDDDPTPDKYDDKHGTSAAGCAAAAPNDICGVGTAPHAKLSGIRLISKLASDATEADALGFKSNRNQVYSNSWGPTDDGKTLEGPGVLLNDVFTDTIQNGRDGKGTLYVWAGGNGRNKGDNGNYDGYNNRPYTLSIGSYDYSGHVAYYSESCSCLFAASPSSGTSGPKIITTSVSTRDNYCTTSFGGTSASAPMVSGIMCLVLNANPHLTWRDIQDIVVLSSAPIDPKSSWQENGAGLHFSHNYGFGKIDAARMVELAENWVLLPPAVYFDSGLGSPQKAVARGASETIIVECDEEFIIEHFVLYFKVSIQKRGDLSLTVFSPFGTASKMMVKHHDLKPGITWVASSNAAWGENSKGQWQLKFTNGGSRTMTIEEYEIVIDGHMSPV
eukprot:CAMPEP_0201475270 /NCGR_PEP_ID=MMETSP0151_2-20130828/719_1 /ASSEMBLY_ACC=CAM_ASM_000257 /TAXON_ID=200890 /ORGANISM="Paramoeba atlantica, Strain 621/1 / CCAP 1560/9" /LENGTH=573 /DNA_ID=CAMNT_0047855315 /DNA_START=74 /DNA_END=1795 /DNA_ORIENTATION=-